MSKWLARFLLLIGVGMVVAGQLYVVITFKIEPRWFGAVVLSIAAYGFLIWNLRDYWTCRKYWVILLTCAGNHFASLWVVRRYLPNFPYMVLGLVGALEVGAIAWATISLCN